MCVYDRIVYFNIVKKDINILSKRGFKGQGGAQKHFPRQQKSSPPPLHKGSRIYNPTDLPLYM